MSTRPDTRTVWCVGLTTLDVVQLTCGRPPWGRKSTASDAYVDVGGPAANAAATVALLGGDAYLVTALGQGVVADLARGRLTELGVDVDDHAGPDTGLAVSSIWVDSDTGDRTVLYHNAEGSLVAWAGPLGVRCAAVLVVGRAAEHRPGPAGPLRRR